MQAFVGKAALVELVAGEEEEVGKTHARSFVHQLPDCPVDRARHTHVCSPAVQWIGRDSPTAQ